MALKATIFKIELQLADLDRGYYQTHALTLARHPSETDERMMVRVAAFALRADPALEFGKGLSTDDEPDLWRKDLTGSIEQWIELGHPDEKVVVRACGRSRAVRVYTYSRQPDLWLNPLRARFAGLKNLEVFKIDAEAVAALGQWADRRMNLQVTIQEGEVTVRNDKGDELMVPVAKVELP